MEKEMKKGIIAIMVILCLGLMGFVGFMKFSGRQYAGRRSSSRITRSCIQQVTAMTDFWTE